MNDLAFIEARGRKFILSGHARTRADQRGISIQAIQEALEHGDTFTYVHDLETKEGFYRSDIRLFVGVIRGTITTVILGAGTNYVDNLKAGAP